MNIKGYFKNWHIGLDYAECNIDGREIYIRDGFFLFGDSRESKKSFLMGFNIYEKWLFWKELKAEVRRRNLNINLVLTLYEYVVLLKYNFID